MYPNIASIQLLFDLEMSGLKRNIRICKIDVFQTRGLAHLLPQSHASTSNKHDRGREQVKELLRGAADMTAATALVFESLQRECFGSGL